MNIDPVFFMAFIADAAAIPTADLDQIAVETLDALRQPEASEMMLLIDRGDIIEGVTVAQAAEQNPLWWTDPQYHSCIVDAMIGGLASKLVEQRHGRDFAMSVGDGERELMFTLLTPHRDSMMAALRRRYSN